MSTLLADRFGPDGEVAQPIVGALLRLLRGRSRGPGAAALRRWSELAGSGAGSRAAGSRLVAGQASGREAAGAARWSARLARRYGALPEDDLPALIFAIHTYLALVLKLFALGLIEGRLAPSRSALLAECAAAKDTRRLGRLLAGLEEDGAWARVGLPGFARDDPYGWYAASWSAALADPVRELARALLAPDFCGAAAPRALRGDAGSPRALRGDAGSPGALRGDAGSPEGSPSWVDPAKALYEALLPGEWRRRRGEFFTPDWLAELAADEIGYRGDPGLKVADPACGSGTFLALAIARLRRTLGRASAERTLATIVEQVQGADLNPLAVLAARTTYLSAVADLVGPECPAVIPIEVGDTLLGEGPTRPADVILTNPPWVRWSALGEGYRRRLWPLWQASGLLAARGYEARLATAEVDLAMLFLHVAAERWLKPGGRMAAVITLELLRGKAGARGFRRFRLEPSGVPLRPLKVHDLSALAPFAAANKTGLLLLRKGETPVYPVPYVVWSAPAAHAGRPGHPAPAESRATLAQVRAATCRRALLARPGDPDAGGPWRLGAAEDAAWLDRLHRPSAYRARRGASTDPYAVYHLEALGGQGRGGLRVANLVARGRTPAPRIEFECEPELLYPALRGRGIERWGVARPALVLCPNRSPRQGDLVPEDVFRERFPRAYAYLCRHREILLARATYWAFYGRDSALDRIPRRGEACHYRWANRPGRAGRVVQVAAAPFYAWRDVGTYSFAPWKVVWGRMSARLGAAVVGLAPLDAARRKPVIPLDTTAFIACSSAAEAHFLCALLNSSPLDRALRSLCARGRGFAAPSAINALALERFDAAAQSHRRLAELSRRCHAATRRGRLPELARLEAEVDRAAASLWGLANLLDSGA